ncbi:MAG: phytoene desaturase family protein [Actinomycetes bacterium]
MSSRAEAPDPPRLPDEVDGVFVGGGHNALVAAAYLARCGLSVLVLEQGDRLGGGVTTAEVTLPAYRHNLHAFFVRWTPEDPVWHDLGLGATGVRTLRPDVQNAIPFADGTDALLTYRDLPRSLEAIARLSSADAEAYAKAHADYRELTQRIIAPLRCTPPLPREEEEHLLGRSALGRRFLDLAGRSALELVTDGFSSEPLRALVAFNVAVRGYLPVIDVPGTGYCTVMALPNSHEGRMVVGGSAEMVRAITASLSAAGGQAAVRSPVASIDVENGRAVGVTTAQGRRVRAMRFVASGVPAPQTLLDLVGRHHLDGSLVRAMRDYRWLEEGLFGVHLALDRRPRFAAEGRHPEMPYALNLALGYESVDDLLADQLAIRDRRLSDTVALHASIPTANDPTQAPPGRHTAFGWQFVASYAPDGADRIWDDAASRRQADAAVATFARYAPGVAGTAQAAVSHSPTDTQRMLPSMPRGDRHHGSYHPDNWGAGRPHPSVSGYRTPVDGLYLCGATQHPGGSFTGHPGYNAAGVIADDLGLDVWWDRPDARAVLLDLE